MASIYPIKVKKQSGRAVSASGGKDYHLVMITNDDACSLVINRWGKKGAWGVGFKVEKYRDLHVARAAYEAKYAEKLNKEYDDHFVNVEIMCADASALVKALGPYFFKMKPADLEWLAPGIDTSECREQKAVAFEERADGSMAAVEHRKMIDLPEEAPEPVSNRIAENPAWGTW